MIAKWFLLLKKSFNTLKKKTDRVFNENAFMVNAKTLWGVLAVSLVPPFFVLLYFLFLLQQEALLDQKIGGLEKKVKSLVVFKTEQDRFVREFGASDLAFLQKYVERIELLKEEADLLSKISAEENYEPIQKRLNFLKKDNFLQFVLICDRKSNSYVESEWALKKEVEVQSKDVLQILSFLEGIKLSHFSQNPLRPQFIIKKFSLKAKEGLENKGFYLNLEILQRSLCEKI